MVEPDKELWRAVISLSVNTEWSIVSEYMQYQIDQCHSRMERCTPEDLAKLQGKVETYREIIGLRNKAKKELAIKPL